MAATSQPFLTDVTELRRRAREHIGQGAVTQNYGGDVQAGDRPAADGAGDRDRLRAALYDARRRGDRHRQRGRQGRVRPARRRRAPAHAADRRAHQPARRHAELRSRGARDALGVAVRRSAQNLVDMIKENLIAERIAVEHYRELIRYFGDKDPTTRVMLEGILAQGGRARQRHARPAGRARRHALP